MIRRLSRRVAGQMPGRVAGRLPGRVAGRLPGRVAGRLPRRVAGRLAARVPRRPSYWLAAAVADLVFYLWPRSDIVVANMERVVAHTGHRRSARWLARHSVRNYAYYLSDFFRFSHISLADIDRAVRPEDWQALMDLVGTGRGVIFAGMHMGNWDYAAVLMQRAGLPFHVVVDTLRPPALNDAIQARRRDMGMTPIPIGEAARGLLRALRRGETVGLLIDRPSPSDGVPVDFFGETCYLPAGAATLALRTGATVVPATLFRRPDGSYQLAVDLTVEPERTGDAQRDIQRLAQRIVRSHEEWIGRRPEQWFMFRPMWPRLADDPSPTAPRLADPSA